MECISRKCHGLTFQCFKSKNCCTAKSPSTFMKSPDLFRGSETWAQLFYLTSFPLTCLMIPINKLSNSGAMPSHYLCQELTPLNHLLSYPTSISSPYLINQQPKHLATFTGNSLLPSLIPTARCPAMFLL